MPRTKYFFNAYFPFLKRIAINAETSPRSPMESMGSKSKRRIITNLVRTSTSYYQFSQKHRVGWGARRPPEPTRGKAFSGLSCTVADLIAHSWPLCTRPTSSLGRSHWSFRLPWMPAPWKHNDAHAALCSGINLATANRNAGMYMRSCELWGSLDLAFGWTPLFLYVKIAWQQNCQAFFYAAFLVPDRGDGIRSGRYFSCAKWVPHFMRKCIHRVSAAQMNRSPFSCVAVYSLQFSCWKCIENQSHE